MHLMMNKCPLASLRVAYKVIQHMLTVFQQFCLNKKRCSGKSDASYGMKCIMQRFHVLTLWLQDVYRCPSEKMLDTRGTYTDIPHKQSQQTYQRITEGAVRCTESACCMIILNIV